MQRDYYFCGLFAGRRWRLTMTWTRAFTLIELLIVVAIIAILAAIAVPNFLEAQTRAKVSRGKADMRTVATGLEVYRLDANKYPPDFQFDAMVPRDLRCYLTRLQVLSSPIAYLTSIPEDVYAAAALNKNTVETAPYKIPYNTGPIVRPLSFDYAFRYYPDGRDENVVLPGLWTKRISRSENVMWALRGVGPDLVATVLGSVSPAATSYDPTNGTLSDGDIFFLGPGIGPESGAIR
jgi:type II secretion system protein G